MRLVLHPLEDAGLIVRPCVKYTELSEQTRFHSCLFLPHAILTQVMLEDITN